MKKLSNLLEIQDFDTTLQEVDFPKIPTLVKIHKKFKKIFFNDMKTTFTLPFLSPRLCTLPPCY